MQEEFFDRLQSDVQVQRYRRCVLEPRQSSSRWRIPWSIVYCTTTSQRFNSPCGSLRLLKLGVERAQRSKSNWIEPRLTSYYTRIIHQRWTLTSFIDVHQSGIANSLLFLFPLPCRLVLFLSPVCLLLERWKIKFRKGIKWSRRSRDNSLYILALWSVVKSTGVIGSRRKILNLYTAIGLQTKSRHLGYYQSHGTPVPDELAR